MNKPEPKPCPFCGGNGHVSMREIRYLGRNVDGNKIIQTGAQVICGRCEARGSLVTAVLVFGGYDQNQVRYVKELKEKAIELWNGRVKNDGD